jgi:hypothetical protein
MSVIRTTVAIALAMGLALAVPPLGFIATADAKGHAKPGKPGKCGVLFFYSTKEKKCLNAALK